MFINSVKAGLKNGILCSWMLIKIIVPVFILITFIKYTPIMDWLIKLFEPVMGIFGLPGEASVPYITAMLLDEYGAIAGIKAVGLTGYHVTIISMMTILAHSFIIESAILKKLDLSVTFFTSYRFITSALMGIVLGIAGGVL